MILSRCNLMSNKIVRCTRCVSGTDIPGILFDEDGVCNFCRIHDRMDKKYPLDSNGNKKLNQLITRIKRKGKNKKYDCIIGVSGGTDSTYTMYLAKKYGLRPLAVHFDNHWNSEIARTNMQNACDALNIDFRSYSVEWNEFRDLQISFLKASVPEVEIPTDIGALAIQYKAAVEEDVGYILNGHSFRMEGMAPLAWSNIDGKYILDVHRQHGKLSLKTFPNLTLWDILDFTFIKNIKIVHILDYVDYRKKDVQKMLSEEIGWTNYGGHHLESLYTRWVANYLHPVKFGIDKRPIEHSAFIRSGLLTREKALTLLDVPFPDESELTSYVLEKLNLSKKEFDHLFLLPVNNFTNYNTYYPVLKSFSFLVKVCLKLGLLGDIGETFAEKYSTY
jgi:N-acetyl sugar amidotransferase